MPPSQDGDIGPTRLVTPSTADSEYRNPLDQISDYKRGTEADHSATPYFKNWQDFKGSDLSLRMVSNKLITLNL